MLSSRNSSYSNLRFEGAEIFAHKSPSEFKVACKCRAGVDQWTTTQLCKSIMATRYLSSADCSLGWTFNPRNALRVFWWSCEF